LDVVFIDYLQLMSDIDSKDTRAISIGKITRNMKETAKELDIVIVI
jgi:replicative DNA helicase